MPGFRDFHRLELGGVFLQGQIPHLQSAPTPRDLDRQVQRPAAQKAYLQQVTAGIDLLQTKITPAVTQGAGDHAGVGGLEQGHGGKVQAFALALDHHPSLNDRTTDLQPTAWPRWRTGWLGHRIKGYQQRNEHEATEEG